MCLFSLGCVVVYNQITLHRLSEKFQMSHTSTSTLYYGVVLDSRSHTTLKLNVLSKSHPAPTLSQNTKLLSFLQIYANKETSSAKYVMFLNLNTVIIEQIKLVFVC